MYKRQIVNGSIVEEGIGKNVLGDPRIALMWIVNELSKEGIGLKANEVITTGTCVLPFTIKANDHIELEFGKIGRISVKLV